MTNILDNLFKKIDYDIKYNTAFTVYLLDEIGCNTLLDNIIHHGIEPIIPGTKDFKKNIRKSIGINPYDNNNKTISEKDNKKNSSSHSSYSSFEINPYR